MDQIPHKDSDSGPIIEGDEFEKAIEAADPDEPEDDEEVEGDPEAEVDPAAKKEPEPEPEKEKDPEPVADTEPSDSKRTLDLLTQTLAELRKKNAAADEDDDEPTEVEVPAHLKALLEHEDPAVQAAAKALIEENKATSTRIQNVEQRLQEQEIQRVAVELDRFIDIVSKSCDPPLTEAEQQVVVDRLTDEKDGKPALARSLDFKDGVNLWFPGRLKLEAPKTTTTTPKAGEEGKDRPVVKVGEKRPDKAPVIDRSGTAGRSPAVPPKVDDSLSLSDTIDRAFAGKL